LVKGLKSNPESIQINMFSLRDSVVVAFYVTLILQCAVSFTSVRQKHYSIKLNAKASAVQESFGYTFAERTVNNVTLQTGGNATGKPVRTVVSKNPRDWTPYSFKDADGEYDVPFINEAMWYRVSVRRNSEKKLTEILNSARDTDERWGKMFEEVFYPVAPVIRMKDKSLIVGYKAMAPGLVYMKTKMDPDLADDIEGMKMVYGFLKNPNNLILPLSRGEGEDIEIMKERHKAGAQIDPELLLMKKDEYVSVVAGPNKGRYGILQGAKNGKLEVCLRSEYKDSYDEFDINELRYLAEPPEKKWMLLTPKEALESLMSKDPYNPTVKAFKKNGLLEEILYPDGRPEGYTNGREKGRSEWENKRVSREDTQGREGGRTVRSIATDKAPKSSNDMDDWGVSSSVKSSSSNEDWGKSSASQSSSKSKTNAFDDSFNIEAWGESLSSAGIKTDFKGKEVEKKVEKAEAAGGTEDFDSFIQGLLSGDTYVYMYMNHQYTRI
jgi:transcription antitermination factor NusG